jgi:hypothetical protein
MKPLLSMLAIASLALATAGSLAAAGCGSAKRSSGQGAKPAAASTASRAASTTVASSSVPHYPGVPQFPGDSDGDNDQNSDEGMRTPGHRGSPADTRAIAAAIKRYYSVAIADDGAGACAMLAASLVKTVPIEYGHGASYLRGKTCAVIMSKLFKHLRRQVVSVATTQRMIEVRLEGDHGYAALHVDLPCLRDACVLNARKLNVANVLVKWEGNSWKIDSLLATV